MDGGRVFTEIKAVYVYSEKSLLRVWMSCSEINEAYVYVKKHFESLNVIFT